MTNITSAESLHQRVSLPVCEVLFEIEFPKDTAKISENVGGRGFTLDSEAEEEMLVRNYVVSLHGIKVDTRRMRRLKELEGDGVASTSGRRSHSQPPPSSRPSVALSDTTTSTLQVPTRRHAYGSSLAPPTASEAARTPAPQYTYDETLSSARPSYISQSRQYLASPAISRASSEPRRQPSEYTYGSDYTGKPQYRSVVSLPTPRSLPPSHHSPEYGNLGRPASTASEEIKRRAMANW